MLSPYNKNEQYLLYICNQIEKLVVMRHCIRYFLIILLSVLLYDGTVQAAGVSCTSKNNNTEQCFLSQAPTMLQQIIHNSNHFLSTPLFMDNVDRTQVPNNRSISLLLNYSRVQWLTNSTAGNQLLHSSLHLMPDPFYYYIIELRKIII